MNALPMLDSADDIDAVVSSTVKALATARGLSADTMAQALGINRGTYFQRLNGSSPWKVRELVAVASFLDVEVVDLLDGLGGKLAPRASGGGARRSAGAGARVRSYRPAFPALWDDEAPLRGHRAGLRPALTETVVAPTGVDPVTSRFSVVRSTN